MFPQSARWQLANWSPGGARAVALSPASYIKLVKGTRVAGGKLLVLLSLSTLMGLLLLKATGYRRTVTEGRSTVGKPMDFSGVRKGYRCVHFGIDGALTVHQFRFITV